MLPLGGWLGRRLGAELGVLLGSKEGYIVALGAWLGMPLGPIDPVGGTLGLVDGTWEGLVDGAWLGA